MVAGTLEHTEHMCTEGTDHLPDDGLEVIIHYYNEVKKKKTNIVIIDLSKIIFVIW